MSAHPRTRRVIARGLGCALGALLSLAALAPVLAHADVFGPISLISQGAFGGHEFQQAEYAHDPAISGNGRYVAFDGSIGGVTGVWRRDLATGALEQVAGGDAELPSLSENGQLISFTTNEGMSLAAITNEEPDAEPKPEAVNVYVRDMSKAPTEAGAFIPASAVSGSEEPLTYTGAGTMLGSAAVGRSAISANGNEVAFVTTAVSNLVRYPAIEEEEEQKGETPKPHTPALQVAVRYLETHETELVSRCYVPGKCASATEPAVASQEGSQLSEGALYPGKELGFAPPPPYGEYGRSAPPGASISADGSTVVWMGAHVGDQASLLPQESRSADYTEPLWRRIEPGSETPTERVTGGSEPSSPACQASGEGALPTHPSASDPCQGPFIVEPGQPPEGILADNGGQTGDFVPRLSADGYTVAFVSQAPLLSVGEDFGRNLTGQESDLYVVKMYPGLSRAQALTPLTELAGGQGAGEGATAPIFDFAVSPDGSQVAFATRRTQFVLGSPAFVSAPAAEPGLNELYDVDLANDTLSRVTHGYGGIDEPASHPHRAQAYGHDPYEQFAGDGALSPSFSSTGNVLAFSSTASNLAFGDTNAPPSGRTGSLDGSDAFVVERTLFTPTYTEQYVSPLTEVPIAPVWRLDINELPGARASVVLYVSTPGAGTLQASATGSVPARMTLRPERRTGHSSKQRRTARARGSARRSAVERQLASAHAQARQPTGETVRLVLKLAKAYTALAAQPGGLSATASVSFNAPGKPLIHQSVAATFFVPALQRRGRRARSSKRAPRKRTERRR